jgi:hypothetical protein
MNGTSGFHKVRSTTSRSPSNRFLQEQRPQFETVFERFFRTHDLIGLSKGISTKREWFLAPLCCTNRLLCAHDRITRWTGIRIKREKVLTPFFFRDYFIQTVFLLIIVLISGTTSAAQEVEEALFTSLPPEERSWAEKKSTESLKKDKTLKQVDYVRLQSGELLEKTLQAGLKGLPIRPVALMIPQIPPATVVTERVLQQSQGYIAWAGHIQGEQGSLVSIVVRESDPSLKKSVALYGTIFLRGRTFRISPAEKDTYAIKEIDTNKLPPEGPPRVWKPKPMQKPLGKHGPPPPRLPEATSLSPLIAEILDVTPPFQNSCQIDVFVAYTSAAKMEAERAGCPPCSIDHEIQEAIALANETYVRSEVNQRLNPVNVAGVNYETCITVNTTPKCYLETGPTTHDLVTDLDNLLGANPDGPVPPLPTQDSYPLRIVHQWRNSLNADLVALWVQGPQDAQGNPIGDCGRSTLLWENPELPGTFDTTFPEQAFSVVSRQCAIDIYSMAHEFGHLGAAHHDRPYEASAPSGAPAPPPIQPDTLYSYGYILPTGTYPRGNLRTIMAQNLNGNQCPPGAQCCTTCVRIPRWSNPNVNFPDHPMGVPTGIKDLTTPPAEEFSADNHTTLNQSASTVSAFRLPKPRPGICEGTVDTTPPTTPTGIRIN